jgi:hypothetical protein
MKIIEIFEELKKDEMISNFHYVHDIQDDDVLYFRFNKTFNSNWSECHFIDNEVITIPQFSYSKEELKIIEIINRKYQILRRKDKLKKLN